MSSNKSLKREEIILFCLCVLISMPSLTQQRNFVENSLCGAKMFLFPKRTINLILDLVWLRNFRLKNSENLFFIWGALKRLQLIY